jgi:hypothetical protein
MGGNMDEERLEPVDANLGISRRTLLRRGAIVGGTLVWAAPAVQSFSRTALAQANGTPVCQIIILVVLVHDDGTISCFLETYIADESCCDCIEDEFDRGATLVQALVRCQDRGECPSEPTTSVRIACP